MRSMTFLVNDRSAGGAIPAVAVTVTENPDGSLSFSLNVIGPYTGDLRGFFFDVADESLIGSLAVTPTSAGFTEFRQGNDSVKDLGNGANMQGLLGSDGGYDAGIEIGSAGTKGGKDDYQSFSFTLTSSAGPLTLDDFANVDFGLRLDSVGWVGGKRNDDVKLLEHTSSAIDARDDSNALAEDAGTTQASGSVFANDANLKPVHFVSAVNGSAGNVGEDLQGTYGTLRLNLNGSYTYTLDNGSAAVQALAQGQQVTETFSYSAKSFDELTSFSSDSATLAITITGTNDAPVIVAGARGRVAEDGPRNASGQLVASDVDQGASLGWSVDNPGTLTNPSYRFLIDNFSITRNDQFYFNDTFGDNVPPPSGPGIAGELAPTSPIPPNAPANYTLNGTFQESGGRVILDGSRSEEVEGVGNPNPRFATSARLLSNNSNDPANLARGLKIDDRFTVEGRFDLVVALDAGDNYGIRLTDSGGGVVGSDLLQVVVRKDAAGNLEVALVELDGPTDTTTTLGTLQLEPLAGENQIVLRLSHDPLDPGVIRASFDLLGGAAPRSFSFSETGRIFGTGTPETSDDEIWTRAEFRAAADGVMQNGVYGTLSVNANGAWHYELNNAAGNVQALAQDEHVTDTFTVRVTDEHGASDTETVTVHVTGTNDLPIITGGTTGGFVAEDTPTQTASGQLFAFDPDHNAQLRWSAGPATVLGQFPGPVQIFGYTADFLFKLDRFTIERNTDGAIFDDTFSDGIAPPSAPNFSNGAPANYIGTFGLLEAGGYLHLDGARMLAQRGVGIDTLNAAQLPVLATNNDANDLLRGLKSDDSFSVSGTFDLIAPGEGQAYGIALTDNAGGGLPPDQLGDDTVILTVRRGAGGELLVQLNQADIVADTSTILAERVFEPGGASQITLRLEHDAQNVGIVRAEFDLLGETFTLANTGRIFGTDTPGYAGDDENWTRAQIVAFGPDAYGESTTYHGTYGSLTVQQDGTWTYTLDNASAAVQALPGITPPGQLLPQDVISVRVVDEYGTSSFRPVFVTVAGSNDPVVITGGATSGTVQEDTVFSASGSISFSDVDIPDLHNAFFTPSPLNSGLGTFTLDLVKGPNAPDGFVAWTFLLDNEAAQFLEEGESATETYFVTIQDSLGPPATQAVTVTVHGTADANQGPTAVADTNGLDAVIEDGFAPGAPFGDPFASGNVLTNDSGVGLQVSALNGAPIFGFGFATGTYGSLQLGADGSWTYFLDNFDLDTNALAQGEAAFDQFTYTASDQQGASASTTLTIAISGTNDFPTFAPGGNTGEVTEDGPSITGGQLVGIDPDHGAVLTFGLPFQPSNVHTANYLFGIDHFTVTRFRPGIDTAPVQILNDDFGNGVPPPNGFFVNGNPAYFSTGTFTEANDRAVMDGALAQGTFPFGGPITVGHTTVATTNNSDDPTQGLRISHDFDVMGRFDAELPQRAGQAYGIALTDQRTGFGGDDHIQLLVRRDDDGVVRVVLREGDATANSTTPIDSVELGAVMDGDQIVLHLTHDLDQPGIVVGSFEHFRGTQLIDSETFDRTGQIFGTETLDPLDDEPFTRAMFLSTSPAQTFTRAGTFGTLVLQETGAWQYFLNNADPDTQALGEGQSAIDSFDALVIDQFRTASVLPIQVTVHGAAEGGGNTPPDITGGVTTGLVYEDGGARIARGQLSAVDVDPGAVLSWTTLGTPTYGFATVDATGRWSYTLDNGRLVTQQLSQDQVVTDTFTVRVADEHGAFDAGSEQLVSVEIRGTNDRPNLPLTPLALSAFEDGGASATTTTAFDVDNGQVLHWSLNRGSALGYFSPYEFRAESFSIQKNGAALFHDEFNDGAAPPSAPDFLLPPPPGGSSATSYTTGGELRESGGKLVFSGSLATGFRGTGNNSLIAGNEANLNTNIDPANTVSGLKKNHQFVVEAVFDLLEPALVRQQYGIQLTDGFGQLADDLVTVAVRLEDDGTHVRLADNNSVLDTGSLIAREQLIAGGADQIRLRLSHAADADTVSGSYELLTGGVVTGSGSLGEVGIFGTDTAFPGDDNNWIRPGLFANALDTGEFVGTLNGAYGTLNVSTPVFNNTAQLDYTPDNANPAVQALALGESVVDTFFVRAIDQFGMTSAQQVDVTVHGTNDAPEITGGVTSGSVTEDGVPTASGQLTSTDVDHGAVLTWTVLDILGFYGTLGVDSTGAWTYTLNPDDPDLELLDQGETDFDFFTVLLVDQHGASDDQLITITVHGADETGNNAPAALPDSNDHDGVIEAGVDFLGLPAPGDPTATGNVVLGNLFGGQDTDPDGDPLRVSAVSVGGVAAQVGIPFVLTYGSLVINEDGSWTYTLDNADPDTNALRQGPIATPEAPVFEQPVSYTVTDGRGGFASAELSIRIAGTNDAPTLVADTNSVTEDDLPTSVTGNVLANDSDPEGSFLTVFAPGVPTPPGFPPPPPIPGMYGTLALSQDGSYVYTTNPALVNFLKAGEVAHDIFDHDYSVSDGMMTSNATLLDIAIHGTGEAPSTALGSVFEDGPRKASGEIDLTGATSFTVAGTGPMTPWADYRFRIDNLNIVRNGTQFVNDDFGNGAPPPAGPGFSYLTGGTFTETGNRANMDGSFAVASGPGFAGHSAILDTGTADAAGLKREQDFRIEARFDLVLPDQLSESYGIRLTDAGVPGGGDDVVEIAVRQLANGTVAVVLREGNVPGEPPVILADIPLASSPTDNRIVLRLEHTANTDEVRGSFDLIDGSVVSQTHSFGATVGHIFGNETWTRAQFLGFSPAQTQNGAYGTLSVDADGDWTYALRNSSTVQALAQDERVTDVFTVQVNDALGSRVETVAIDVFGTNDTPFGSVGFSGPPAPGTSGAYVIEDGRQQVARGFAFGSDVDHGHPVQWSVTANTVPGPLTPYTADYRFTLDELRITRDGADFMVDTFGDGVAPPNGPSPDFPYLTTGVFSESAGRAILDGDRAGAISGAGTSDLMAAHVAILDTNLGDASPGRGLKSHHNFTIEARFDLDPAALPAAGQSFGVSLSDRSFGELPFEQQGDDIVGLLVTRNAAGELVVIFEERDAVADTVTILDSATLAAPAPGSQITLRLGHDTADFGRVSASFQVSGDSTPTLLSPDDPAQRGDRIFGAETPSPYDDEGWTRVQVWAFGPDSNGASTTAQGAFGSLAIEPDGDWTYTLNNNAANVQVLGAGEIGTDSFNFRSTDAYGASTSRAINVNVIGTGDGPQVPVNAMGGPAAETFVGSALDDYFAGGGGADLLIGLAGRDTFDFNNLSEAGDTISDFTPGPGGDILDVSNLLLPAPPPPPGMPPLPGIPFPHNFVRLGTFQTADGTNTQVSVNADGVGDDFVQIANLQGVGGLTVEQMIADGNLLLGI